MLESTGRILVEHGAATLCLIARRRPAV